MVINEEDRLQSLYALDLLDSLPEAEYDELVQLASEICDTPISLVSLVDRERQWFKASVGLSAKETHRDVSFCAHAIHQTSIFTVEDATRDTRFTVNPLVTGEMGIRFYAGIPLQAPDGNPIGTLCVIDTVPRVLTESQRNALTILGRQVEARVTLRLKQKDLEATLSANQTLSQSLQKSNDLFRAFMDHSPFMGYIKDRQGRFVFYNQQVALQFGIECDQWLGKSDADLFPAEIAETYREHDLQVLAGNTSIEFDEVTPTPQGNFIHWRSYKFPFRQPDGELMLAGISMDVTVALQREAALEHSLAEKNALAKRLESSAALFHAFADLSPHLTYMKSEDGRYVFYNRLFAEQFGISQTEWIGKISYDILPPEVADRARKNDLAVFESGDRRETQDQLLCANGSIRYYRSLKFTYRDADGHRMLAGIAIDITEQVIREQKLTEANRRLDQLATTDSLTSLANRRAFEARIAMDFSGAVRRKRPLSLLLMDIDNFKRRNDQLGHAAGDDALQLLSRVLLRCGRLGDLPARIGGEEFAVLLPETNSAGAQAVARRIQAALAAEEVGPLPLTVSIGVVSLDDTVHAWDRLVARADAAMYEAKRSGKNCIVVHRDPAPGLAGSGDTSELGDPNPPNQPSALRPPARPRPAGLRLKRRRSRLRLR